MINILALITLLIQPLSSKEKFENFTFKFSHYKEQELIYNGLLKKLKCSKDDVKLSKKYTLLLNATYDLKNSLKNKEIHWNSISKPGRTYIFFKLECKDRKYLCVKEGSENTAIILPTIKNGVEVYSCNNSNKKLLNLNFKDNSIFILHSNLIEPLYIDLHEFININGYKEVYLNNEKYIRYSKRKKQKMNEGWLIDLDKNECMKHVVTFKPYKKNFTHKECEYILKKNNLINQFIKRHKN